MVHATGKQAALGCMHNMWACACKCWHRLGFVRLNYTHAHLLQAPPHVPTHCFTAYTYTLLHLMRMHPTSPHAPTPYFTSCTCTPLCMLPQKGSSRTMGSVIDSTLDCASQRARPRSSATLWGRGSRSLLQAEGHHNGMARVSYTMYTPGHTPTVGAHLLPHHGPDGGVIGRQCTKDQNIQCHMAAACN